MAKVYRILISFTQTPQLLTFYHICSAILLVYNMHIINWTSGKQDKDMIQVFYFLKTKTFFIQPQHNNQNQEINIDLILESTIKTLLKNSLTVSMMTLEQNWQ
jgi:hypothetical protein